MKTRVLALCVIASSVLLLLVGSGVAFATSQPLSATLVGGVTNAGTQVYNQSGGQLMFGQVLGYTLNPATASLNYSFNVQVTKLQAMGSAQLSLVAQTIDGHSLSLSGAVNINQAQSAATFLNCQFAPGPCTKSSVPALFYGPPKLTATLDGQPITIPSSLKMVFESGYLNPWGGPIFIGTSDTQAIILVATYSQCTIQWNTVVSGGLITGTLGSSPVAGTFVQVGQETEDLVAGVALDSGTITLSGMTPGTLNSVGTYSGTSSIPAAGFPCPAGLLPPGTCTETGFQSTGSFNLIGQATTIAGTYSTTWSTPAFGFTSNLVATAT